MKGDGGIVDNTRDDGHVTRAAGFPIAANPGKLIVRDIEGGKVTPGGLVIVGSTGETSTAGDVMAVGPWETDFAGNPKVCPYKPGSVVYYNVHTGTFLYVDGVKYRSLPQYDVLGTAVG